MLLRQGLLQSSQTAALGSAPVAASLLMLLKHQLTYC